MIVSLLYKVTWKLLAVPAVLLRGQSAKDAGLLVLRHENTVLHRQLTGPIRYEPADRFWSPRPTSREFLTAQAKGIIAADFFHIDTALGKRLYALAFLEHGTRRLHITGVTSHPTREWTVQQARNLAAHLGARMESLQFMLRDRDGKYGDAFDAVFEAEELRVIKSAPQAPRLNAHCERIIGSIRREVLDHVLITGEGHARQVLAALPVALQRASASPVPRPATTRGHSAACRSA